MSRPQSSFIRTLALTLTVLALALAVLALGLIAPVAHAAEPATSSGTAIQAPANDNAGTRGAAAPPDSTATGKSPDDSTDKEDADAGDDETGSDVHETGDSEVVAVGGDAVLAAGSRAEQVVAVFGSARSEGDVSGEVVAVFGDTHVSGHTGGNAVAVFGNNVIDGRVDGQVVTVAGDLELGPHADVGGEVVVVGGTLHRAPGALIHGQLRQVGSFMSGGVHGVNAWLRSCLLYGRLLTFAPEVGWAWGLALVLLLLYVALAVLFREPFERCVELLEARPGHALLAGLLALLLTPIIFVLLAITVVGALALPLLAIGFICAGLFGKAVVLGSLGRRGGRLLGSPASPMQPAPAVALGGLLVLLLYTVPVLGVLVFNVLGLFGLGIAVYAAIIASQRTAAARAAASGAGPSAPAPGELGVQAGDAPAGANVGAAAGAATGAAPERTEPPASAAASPLSATSSAGFWIRMAALLIDIVLVSVVWHLLQGHGGGIHFGHGSDDEGFGGVPLLVLALYGAMLWKLKGTTVGGLVFDLKVVRADGQPMDWMTAMIRALGCFLSLIVAGLGFIWIAFDAHGQAWHDKIAGTLVLRTHRKAVHA